MNIETTTVEQVDLDLDALLSNASESVMLPSKEDSKPNFFTTKKDDLSFLDKKIQDTKPEVEIKLDKDGKPIAEEIIKPTAEEIQQVIIDNDDPEKTAGRKKLDKNGLLELTNKLIEKKLIIPFDDEKKLEDYTLQDFEELYEANDVEKQKKIREQVPGEFFTALPRELQYAAKYVSDGGTDLKGLFRTLASVEENKALDPNNEEHQKQIARTYLQATQFGTPDEIEEQITEWDDANKLGEKALKFKPKLDSLSEKHVAYKLQQQEALKIQQKEQAEAYMDNVYNTLQPADLNGLKLDKKTQNLLFSGLVQPAYQSVNGKQTNLLGHLLEKYQFVEPNHGLVAEALWLLADPEGYRSKVREVTKKEVVLDTVKKLKTEESRKLASHEEVEIEDKNAAKKQTIARPGQGFFKRKF